MLHRLTDTRTPYEIQRRPEHVQKANQADTRPLPELGREATYSAALELVAIIDRDCEVGTGHYYAYDADGERVLLTDLYQVVLAILDGTLVTVAAAE